MGNGALSAGLSDSMLEEKRTEELLSRHKTHVIDSDVVNHVLSAPAPGCLDCELVSLFKRFSRCACDIVVDFDVSMHFLAEEYAHPLVLLPVSPLSDVMMM